MLPLFSKLRYRQDTVCHAVLNLLETAHLTVDTRGYSTTTEIQRDILQQLGVDVDKAGVSPNEYAAALLRKAKQTRKTLYLDNAETPITRYGVTFCAWLLTFARESDWRVLYSTQRQLDAECIETFPLGPLPDDDAYELFASRWWKEKYASTAISSEEKQLARDVSVTLLSGHPLAIVIATSPKQRRRYSFIELKNDLQKQVLLEYKDDPDHPHASMSAALSLAIYEIENSSVPTYAKALWAMLAQYPGAFSDELFSLAFEGKSEYLKARTILRNFSLIDEYVMLEPVKSTEVAHHDIHAGILTEFHP